MTERMIKKLVTDARNKLAEAARMQSTAERELRQARELCFHFDKETWTNNDGDGQFKVERCRVCGMQRDGGLN